MQCQSGDTQSSNCAQEKMPPKRVSKSSWKFEGHEPHRNCKLVELVEGISTFTLQALSSQKDLTPFGREP